jgi:hypothetical protein
MLAEPLEQLLTITIVETHGRRVPVSDQLAAWTLTAVP